MGFVLSRRIWVLLSLAVSVVAVLALLGVWTVVSRAVPAGAARAPEHTGVAAAEAGSPGADPRTQVLSSTFTSADVGFAEGGIRPEMVDKFDAMDAYVGAKKPIVRADLDWATVEPKDDELHWDTVDTVVSAAQRRGLRVLLVLAYAPPWVNGAKGHSFPTDDAAWVDIVERTVARYPHTIQAYEIWNEPNMLEFADYGSARTQAGRTRDRKTRYWELVKLAYPRIKAGCPACTVLAGGSASGDHPTDPDDTSNTSASWLQAGYDAAAGRSFDAVGHHPYPAATVGEGPNQAQCSRWYWSQFGPPFYTHPRTGRKCGGELAAVREVMVRNGDAGKKIWATEWGYPTGGAGIRKALSLAEIRNHMIEGVYMWRALDYTGPLFLYSYRDAAPHESRHCAPQPILPQCRMGVTDVAGEPKEPLYSGLSTALRGDWQTELLPGQVLRRRSALRSTGGRFELRLESNGNLVLYEAPTSKVLWAVGGRKGTRLVNQNDGNLVLRDERDLVVWESRSRQGADATTTLSLRPDGNLVLMSDAKKAEVWSTATVR